MNPPQRNLPLCQPPRPNPERDAHVEEIENQRPAEDDGVERPGAFFRQLGSGDDDRPGEDPEEVGTEGLVEVPAGAGGEEDGGELVLHGVEDVAPVYVLSWGVSGGGFGDGDGSGGC